VEQKKGAGGGSSDCGDGVGGGGLRDAWRRKGVIAKAEMIRMIKIFLRRWRICDTVERGCASDNETPLRRPVIWKGKLSAHDFGEERIGRSSQEVSSSMKGCIASSSRPGMMLD
jgi:hypothetical protein